MNNTINETVTATTQEFLGVTIPFTISPAFDIFLISLGVAIFITIIHKYFTDQVKIKELRKDMKERQKKLREVMKENPEKAQKMQKDIMHKSFETMKQQFQPKVMLIISLPLLIILPLVANVYGDFGTILDLRIVAFGWLGTYITFSVINSILVKKLLAVA